MPGIDLSTLNAEELRSLLSAVQRREQSALADEVAAELAARRARPASWAGAAIVAQPEPEPAPQRRTQTIVVGAAVVGSIALALGWQLTRPEQTAPIPPVLPVVVAPPPTSLPPAQSPAKLEVLPRPELAPSPRARLPSTRESPASATRRAAPARSGSPQERRLRLAYERALDAGVDPQAIDRGQARWRQKLARTRDPERRRALYARRIGELEAAARWNGGR